MIIEATAKWRKHQYLKNQSQNSVAHGGSGVKWNMFGWRRAAIIGKFKEIATSKIMNSGKVSTPQWWLSITNSQNLSKADS